MVTFKEVINKAQNMFGSPPEFKKGTTPNEVELNSFIERERQDQIKKKLHFFRKKNAMLGQGENGGILGKSPSLLKSNSLLKERTSILKSKKTKTKSLLDAPNVFL